jgi:protein-tyrosine phosphatase
VAQPGNQAEFQVVFVCTGNRFRSPLAAELFRARTTGLPVSVRSAGTLELGPASVLTEALEHGSRLGIDLSSHEASCLVGEDLSGADLIIGFEHMHVATAVVEAHAKRERTFTLPELVGLLENSSGDSTAAESIEQAETAVAQADALRRSAGLPIGYPEIADPLGAGREVSMQTAEIIDTLTNRLVLGLFGVSPTGARAEPGTESRRGWSRGR